MHVQTPNTRRHDLTCLSQGTVSLIATINSEPQGESSDGCEPTDQLFLRKSMSYTINNILNSFLAHKIHSKSKTRDLLLSFSRKSVSPFFHHFSHHHWPRHWPGWAPVAPSPWAAPARRPRRPRAARPSAPPGRPAQAPRCRGPGRNAGGWRLFW